MKQSLILFGLCAVLGSAMADEQVPTGGRGGPVPTRNILTFSKLENTWIDALRHHDADALARIVSDDFEIRSASAPGVPTAREEVLQAWAQLPARDSSIGQMAVHEYKELAVVSFVWTLGGGAAGASESFFVVDTWKRAGDDWKLAVRYAAPVQGGAAVVPGAVAPSAQSLRKKM